MLKKSSLYAVILAGGEGKRFWPASRGSRPKQFLSLTGKQSLLQETVARVKPLVPAKNIYVVGNRRYKGLLTEQLRGTGIPTGNVLLEPSPKNTAPAIAWAAGVIHRRDPKGIMMVLPSDHVISARARFLQILRRACVQAGKGHLVTLGIVPTRPETGYGYLKFKKTGKRMDAYPVAAFVEKPSLSVARRYLKSKQYFWNSGMFIWSTETILKALAEHVPDLSRGLEGSLSTRAVYARWPSLPSVSIDYGVMEKARAVVTVPAENIGWSDLGSWESLWEYLPKDKKGNALEGNASTLDVSHSLIRGKDKKLAVIGLDNVVVVDTGDVILICDRARSQDVKLMYERLVKEDKGRYTD